MTDTERRNPENEPGESTGTGAGNQSPDTPAEIAAFVLVRVVAFVAGSIIASLIFDVIADREVSVDWLFAGIAAVVAIIAALWQLRRRRHQPATSSTS